MIRGQFVNFKQVVFFDFNTPVTERLLSEVVKGVESTGLRVGYFNTDQGMKIESC